MDVKFQHHKIKLQDAELRLFGSPHFSNKEAGEAIQGIVNSRSEYPIFEDCFEFDRKQILSANEVFSESAMADPLADLEIWDEWRTGAREFPFAGKYSRLSIAEQKGKVASSTALGVLGEIFTGLFCQNYISPWVLVRPIRRWPDFIYYQEGGRYAFVESKAFTGTAEKDGSNLERIRGALLRDCLVDTVRQLNADPFVTVWLMFTELNSIHPMSLSVTALELDAPDAHREQIVQQVVPGAVIKGITERVLSAAIASKDDTIVNRQDERMSKKDIQAFWDEVLDVVPRETERLVGNAAPKSLHDEVCKAVAFEAGAIVRKYKKPPKVSDRGQRLTEAKLLASAGKLAQLRSIGDKKIYLADLNEKIRTEIETSWKAGWVNANQSLCCLKDIELYRCSTAALGMSEHDCQGESVEMRHIYGAEAPITPPDLGDPRGAKKEEARRSFNLWDAI